MIQDNPNEIAQIKSLERDLVLIDEQIKEHEMWIGTLNAEKENIKRLLTELRMKPIIEG